MFVLALIIILFDTLMNTDLYCILLKDGSIRDGYGREIELEENEKWNKVDADYTPYNNILSSAWHSLRHKDFIWAVIEVKALDTLIYYKDFNEIQLSEPCSHPDMVRCGHTSKFVQ